MERQQAENTKPCWKEQGKNYEDVNVLCEFSSPREFFRCSVNPEELLTN